jgi:hypothetical protein
MREGFAQAAFTNVLAIIITALGLGITRTVLGSIQGNRQNIGAAGRWIVGASLPNVVALAAVLWVGFNLLFLVSRALRLRLAQGGSTNPAAKRTTSASEPRGEVKGLESVHPYDVSAGESAFIAWIQIDTGSFHTTATDWLFTIQRIDGTQVRCTPITRDWPKPAQWPAKISYTTLDQIQNAYIPPLETSNVTVCLTAPERSENLDWRSFEARFKGITGAQITCRMPT